MADKIKNLNVGLVMPIAPIDGCSAEHWIDVKRIIHESVSSIPEYNCDPKLVSEGNSVGLIHRRIVEGLYTSDIIICDVSCKNPNVMFELGMRLAFDKPTVIIKDDQTDYSFDTGVIEHLQYPRDLRYKDIVEFKERLAEKVKATYEDSNSDPNHSPFLKSFGTFKVAYLKEDTVTADQYIINALQEIQAELAVIKASNKPPRKSISVTADIEKMMHGYLTLQFEKIIHDHAGDNEISLSRSEITDIVRKIDDSLRRNGMQVSQINIYDSVARYFSGRGININDN